MSISLGIAIFPPPPPVETLEARAARLTYDFNWLMRCQRISWEACREDDEPEDESA